MKRFANALNVLCLPLLAAIAFTTVVVAKTERLSEPARMPGALTALVDTANDARLAGRDIPDFGNPTNVIRLRGVSK